jgi:hypothetical protein
MFAALDKGVSSSDTQSAAAFFRVVARQTPRSKDRSDVIGEMAIRIIGTYRRRERK